VCKVGYISKRLYIEYVSRKDTVNTRHISNIIIYIPYTGSPWKPWYPWQLRNAFRGHFFMTVFYLNVPKQRHKMSKSNSKISDTLKEESSDEIGEEFNDSINDE
jgi:hypothetical protein